MKRFRGKMLIRVNNLEFGHHRIVAPLEPSEQKRWLEIAEKESLSVHRLRDRIKKEKKAEAMKGITGLPIGKYRIIYADPPWEYNNTKPNH